MSRFEYLSVLVSIVIALALSELVQGWGALIRRRSDVRLYPLHLAWSVLAALGVLAWSRSERLHVALTLACYALFFGFVAEAYRPL